MKTFEKLLFYIVRTSAVFLPLIAFLGILEGSIYSFSAFFVVFVFYFIIELILWISGLSAFSRLDNEFQFVDPEQKNNWDQINIYVYSFLHILLIPSALYILSSRTVDFAYLGSILSLAATCGTVGGLAGHEFMHRSDRLTRNLGVLVYGMLNYGHFKVSHILGHHVYVGTYGDWSTARKNESYYRFWNRAVIGGYIGAWNLEKIRLKKRGLHFFSFNNEMILISIFQVTLNLSIYLAFGGRVLLTYWLICFMAISLKEIVNYLSHYGLNRVRNSQGRLESIKNSHSWESNNKVTNWFIFNAGKHCHHHRRPSAHHDDLKLCHEKDYLPYGLPMMALIALVPPLYFKMMNKKLEQITSVENKSAEKSPENKLDKTTKMEILNV